MRYVVIALRILAWSWAVLIILGICSLNIYINGFWDGMSRASSTVLSPAGLTYIFTPSFFLAGLAVIVRKMSETGKPTWSIIGVSLLDPIGTTFF